MKKVISVSAEESVIEDFTALAHEFGTNRTNLISMFMVDFIENRKVCFIKPENSISYESFSEQELNELKVEGKASFDSICNSLKNI